MHVSFLKYLTDPMTHEGFELICNRREGEIVVEGFLKSPSNSYPIIRSIPRFSGYNESHNYTKSFSYEWNKWSKIQFDSENIGNSMEGYSRDMWESILDIKNQGLNGSIVGDFGCGSGRYIETVRMKQGKVIGIDLSDSVESAREHFRGDSNVLICQADVLNPPIKEGVLDIAFSIGVLHHTPDSYKGFREMLRCLKNGGKLAVSVYGRNSYYSSKVVNLYRLIFKILWPVLGHYPPLVYAYTTVYIQRILKRIPILKEIFYVLFPYVDLPDIRWAVLDTFDSVTPSYQNSHEFYEVFQWFKKCGMTYIEPSERGGISMHGIKI